MPDYRGNMQQIYNIIGHFYTLETAARPRILLGAHYDTRPWCDEEEDYEERYYNVPGANDGASGVGVLMEVARQLGAKLEDSTLTTPVDIIFFDCEDMGTPHFYTGAEREDTWCLGSQLWATHYASLSAKPVYRYGIVHNLENLFDTIHDEGKNDYEYLPDGGMKWTSFKYENKIKKMAEAVAALGTDYDPRGATCIGVAEVENIGCLYDLCAETNKTYNRRLKPILLEGPDRRGVDVGFLYDTVLFKPSHIAGYELHAHYADGGVIKTRLQLLVSGYLMGDGKPEKIHMITNHWPSRYGGELSSRPGRDSAAMLDP